MGFFEPGFEFGPYPSQLSSQACYSPSLCLKLALIRAFAKTQSQFALHIPGTAPDAKERAAYNVLVPCPLLRVGVMGGLGRQRHAQSHSHIGASLLVMDSPALGRIPKVCGLRMRNMRFVGMRLRRNLRSEDRQPGNHCSGLGEGAMTSGLRLGCRTSLCNPMRLRSNAELP